MTSINTPWGPIDADIIAIIISVVSLIITGLANWYITKRQYRWQYTLKFIDEIFPSLLSEIRKLKDEYSIYMEKFVDRVDLELLDAFIKNGKIEYIKNIDKKLYDDMLELNRLHPLLNELLSERSMKSFELKRKWVDFLTNKYPHGGFHIGVFIDDIFYKSWKEIIDKANYDIIKENFEEVLKTTLEQNSSFKDIFNHEEATNIMITMATEDLNNLVKNYNDNKMKLYDLVNKIINLILKIIVKPI